MNRKQRRAMNKQIGAQPTDELAQKISQFDKLPQQCTACHKEFDKQDKKMLQSWSVVVKQEVVRLFCPHCINKTKEALEHVSTKNRSE
jgi:ribosomal protein L44E